MGNREPTVLSEETALVAQRLRALRDAPVEGISRRTLHRKLSQWPELDVTDK